MEEDYLKKLHDALVAQPRHHEPWITGVVNLTGPETSLFFKCGNGSVRIIDLGSITDGDIQDLFNACKHPSSATENVLGDTYHKAGKLKVDAFVWRFNPDSGHFTAQLAQRFCPWDTKAFDKAIRAEPYELKVYSKGSFQKTHHDTTLAQDMFASIVFVLPTHHKGGNLILRAHKFNRELNFDAPSVLQSSSSPPGSVAWVALYNDVEYEVLEVIEGSCIMITFHLYFDPSRAAPKPPKQSPKHEIKIPENSFTLALRETFRDAAFIRKHKYLGFGFEYKYGFRKYFCPPWALKGPDAFLYRILEEAGLKPSMFYLYQSGVFGWSEFWVMLSRKVHGRSVVDSDEEDSEKMESKPWLDLCDDELEYLMDSDKNAKIVWRPNESEETVRDASHPWIRSYFHEENIDGYRDRTTMIDWVMPATTNCEGKTDIDNTYEGEPAQEFFCYSRCIIVDVREVPCPSYSSSYCAV